MAYSSDPVGDANHYFSELDAQADIIISECEAQLKAKGLPQTDCDECSLLDSLDCPMHPNYSKWQKQWEEDRKAEEALYQDFVQEKELGYGPPQA